MQNSIIKIGSGVVLVGLLIFFGSTGPAGVAKEMLVRMGSPFLTVSTKIRNMLPGSGLSAEEQKKLSQENFILHAENAELDQLRVENRSLRRALKFGDANGLNMRGAKVLFYGQELGHEFLWVDQGEDAGISVGDPVVDDYGFFVGKVKEVHDNFAKIEIASNPGSVFEIDVLPLRAKALARGLGGRIFSIELLPADALIRLGDYVLLRGADIGSRSYFFLGTVSRLGIGSGNSAFKEARLKLISKVEELGEVFIIAVKRIP